MYLLSAAPFRFAFLLTVAAYGCSSDEALECDGHGTYDHGHCHCEAGYAMTSDEQGCVERDDVPTEPDAPPASDPDAPAPPATELVFAPTRTSGFTTLAQDGTRVWILEGVEGTAVLSLEVYPAYGGLTEPGVVPMAAAETSYATCGTCVLYQTDCEAHGDHYHCAHVFMPQAQGAVSFSALGTTAGSQLAGSLSDLLFQEVTIENESLETTPVPAGERLHLAEWMFDVVLTERP